MSGIAAVLSLDGSALPRSEIERLANVLKPQGPDRQEIVTRRNVAFVACLHHLTPEDLFERQPLVVADRFVMLFDGRIDNRSELSESLGIEAGELSSMPDSEITFRLYDRWGENAFEHIVGVFAIIIADLKNGRLICARDQMGLRVLHYHCSTKRFAVATTPEALFALSWVPRILNKDKIGDTLVQRGLNGETTYYREIFRVLPGASVRVRGSSFSKVQFWNPENIADVRFKDDHEYVEAFQERFEKAVRARLRSRGVPCASITGGLDSSSICVIAADMLATTGNRLNTFTAVPEAGFSEDETSKRYFDETPYVRQVAKANSGIVPHFVRPSEGPLIDKIAKQIRVGGAPSGGILNGLWVMDILSAARSAGHDVMLGGDMGNLTMSYDGSALPTVLFKTGRWWKLLVEIIRTRDRRQNMIRQRVIAPFIPASLFRRYKHWRRGSYPPWHFFSAIHPAFAAQSGVVERAAHEFLAFDEARPRDGKLTRIQDIHCFSETADWFAQLRATYGIDVRTPAFDRQLVEFCIGIPEDQYLHKGVDRWLIRRAMKGRLPDAILASTKVGVQSADWFPRLTRERIRIQAELRRLTESSEVASIVDLERLLAMLNDWPDREPPAGSHEALMMLWALPQAMAAAAFIENVTGANYGR